MRNIIFIFTITVFLCGCFGSPNFLAADKHITGDFMTMRWYLKPEYKDSKLLEGITKDYGTSFKKIEYKYEKIYYEKTPNGRDDIIIPKKDIWRVNHNYQDDESLFIYKKEGDRYIKHTLASGDKVAVEDSKYPVKECYSNGWCKLYPNRWRVDLYIKQSILDKRLSEE